MVKKAVIDPRFQNVDQLEVDQKLSKLTLSLYVLNSRAFISIAEWSFDLVLSINLKTRRGRPR